MSTVQTIIREVTRRGTSSYGNPTLTLHTDDGEYITQANAGWAYGANNPEWRDVPVTLHLSRYGRVRYATRDTETDMEGYTLRQTIDLLRDETTRAHVAHIYDAALTAGPRGTMRAWFTAHDGEDVHTLQGGRMPWFPGPRTVDTSRTSYVTLNWSRRDYAGCRVVGATDDALIVTAKEGTPIIYYTD